MQFNILTRGIVLGAVALLGSLTAVAGGTRLKAMSFNIRFDTPKDTAELSWENRRGAIATMLEQEAPDVVGMQELLASMESGLHALTPAYAYYRIPHSEDVRDRMTGDVAVAYRRDLFEPCDSGYFWLSATPEVASKPWNSTDRHYRSCVWVKLRHKVSGDEFYFFTTHFPYKKEPVDTEVRARCAQLICNKIHEIAGDSAACFVTGDMNASDNPDDPRSPSLAPYFAYMGAARRDAEFSNCRSSFNGFGRISPEIRGKNLDHIFYRNATPRLFETVDYPGFGTLYISDHYPILCHFDL